MPQSRNNIPSSLISLCSILHTRLAELLPLAINPCAMGCTSFNSDTYQFSSIVSFFNGNQSICHYLPLNWKNIPIITSSLIVVSSIFHAQKAELLLLAINPCVMCWTSLNYNTYHFRIMDIFLNVISLSVTICLEARRTFLPNSMPCLVYCTHG